MHTLDLDAISIDQLRKSGSLKWSLYPESIGAFIAEMDFGTAPVITRALHEAVNLAQFGYLPHSLAEDLREATAGWYRESYGWDTPPTRIHPIPDVIKALEIAIEHFSAPDTPVIVPTPAYMPFLTVPKSLGREIIEVPLTQENGRHVFNFQAIDQAFARGAKLFVLCNPNNPLGRVFDRTELLELSEVITRNGGRVFSDEIHAPITYPGKKHIPYASLSAETAKHTVTGASASKAWNIPGLKTAQFILSNEADEEVWERIGFAASHGASTLGVIANTVAYREGGEWLTEVTQYLDANRRLLGDLLAEYIPEIGYTMPEATYIAWLDARKLELGDAPGIFFREKAGVALTEGSDTGKAGEGFLRFVFATPGPIMEEAVRKMAAALNQHN